MNVSFSEKLKKLRKDKGITQQALADAIKEKRSSIANYESNNALPGFEILNKLSSFFNVPVGYLTGKTDTLVSEYTFKTLEDYINIVPNETALWLRIKNPIKYSNYTGNEVYGPNQKSKIEFVNPLDEKNTDSRIYLEFLSLNDKSGDKQKLYKSIYTFACKYGFLGEVFNVTDDNFDNSFPLFKPFETGIILNNGYYNPSLYEYDLIHKNFDFPEKEKYAPILEKHNINGYFEPIATYEDAIKEMDRNIYLLSSNNDSFKNTLTQISYKTSGIRKRYLQTESGEIVESIGYRSLLALMYYELFLDIKNGDVPHFCYDCNKYYLPSSNHKCKK